MLTYLLSALKKLIELIKNNKIVLSLIVLIIITLLLHLNLHEVRILGRGQSVFYLDEEITFAAYFVTVVSAFVGVLFLLNLKNIVNKFDRLVNFSVGLFFVLLSLDEFFSIHEFFNGYIKENISLIKNLDSVFSFSWIISLGVIVIIALFLLLSLLIREKRKIIKISYLFGIFCFIGVLAIEIIGANSYGDDSYIIYVGIEETLEMLGVVAFLNGVLYKNKSLNSGS